MNETNHPLDRDARRALVKELGEALRGFEARPADLTIYRRLLALPLERSAWEGLGADVDDELLELAPIASTFLRMHARPRDAIAWSQAALEPCERAVREAADDRARLEKAMIRLIRVLLSLGSDLLNSAGADDAAISLALPHKRRAAALVHELPSDDELRAEMDVYCECNLAISLHTAKPARGAPAPVARVGGARARARTRAMDRSVRK